MRMLVKWQIASCRRIGESCRILWEDVDYDKKMYMVRDVKDPKVKKGNHMWFPALGDAWGILTAQEMVDERVFPYRSQSVSASFTVAKVEMKIDNLHLHDMRREGATRLLEMGYTSSEVRLVTGHKTTNILDRVYLAPDPALLHLGPASMRNRPQLAIPQ
jgi:integrase